MPPPMTSIRPSWPDRASWSRCGVGAASNGVAPPRAAMGRSAPPHRATMMIRPCGRGVAAVAACSDADAFIDPELLDSHGHGRRHQVLPVALLGDLPAHPAATDRLFRALPHHL